MTDKYKSLFSEDFNINKLDRKNDGHINVKDYGAKGDGVQDDAFAFQNAINALTNGGVIIVPSGDYRMNVEVIVNAKITIRGDSATNLLRTNPNSSTSVFVLNSDCKINGLNFKNQNNTGETRGIKINTVAKCKNINIEKCYFYNFSKGVYIPQAFQDIHENITIFNNYFDTCTNAIFADRVKESQFIFNRCMSNSSSGAGISFYGGNNNNISFNKIQGGKTGISFIYTESVGGFQGGVFNNIIKGNNIEGVTEESIGLDVRGDSGIDIGAQELDTVSATYVSGSTYGVTLGNANWSTAAGVYFNYQLIFTSGKLQGTVWLINLHSNANFVLSGMTKEIHDSISVGDEVIIGQPMFHNVISQNVILAGGYSGISLWGFSYSNIITDNIIKGIRTNTNPINVGVGTNPHAIRISSIHGLGRTGQIVPLSNGMKAPCEYNIVSNNSITHGDIVLQSKAYGSSPHYVSLGNRVTNNKVLSGDIWLDYQDENALGFNDVKDGSIIESNTQVSNVRPTNVYRNMPYFDRTLGKIIFVKDTPIKESVDLTITSGATSSGNVTINLNGVSFNVSVASGDTNIQVADKIRIINFTGWIVSIMEGNNKITFTSKTDGNKTDATYSAGTTGATGTITTTAQGTDIIWVDATGTTV